MNLLIHDIAAAIEREADVRSPRRASRDPIEEHLRPWAQAPSSSEGKPDDEPIGRTGRTR